MGISRIGGIGGCPIDIPIDISHFMSSVAYDPWYWVLRADLQRSAVLNEIIGRIFSWLRRNSATGVSKANSGIKK